MGARQMDRRFLIAASTIGWLCSVPVAGEVLRVEVSEQRDWAPGQALAAGPYESVKGTVWYEIDPNGVEARDIVDGKLAPRNARGKVEFHGPFLLIRP